METRLRSRITWNGLRSGIFHTRSSIPKTILAHFYLLLERWAVRLWDFTISHAPIGMKCEKVEALLLRPYYDALVEFSWDSPDFSGQSSVLMSLDFSFHCYLYVPVWFAAKFWYSLKWGRNREVFSPLRRDGVHFVCFPVFLNIILTSLHIAWFVLYLLVY